MRKILTALFFCSLSTFSNSVFCLEIVVFGGAMTLHEKYNLDLQHPYFKRDGKTIFSTYWRTKVGFPAANDGVIEISTYKDYMKPEDGNASFIETHKDKIENLNGFKSLAVQVEGVDYPIVLLFDESVVMQIIDSDQNVWKEMVKTFRK